MKSLTLKNRPLMNYVDYDRNWTTVEINDRFADSWQWGGDPYFDWCCDNCLGDYNIVKYDRRTIHGRFRNPADAMMFKLKWS